jgi:hypothetical protein
MLIYVYDFALTKSGVADIYACPDWLRFKCSAKLK